MNMRIVLVLSIGILLSGCVDYKQPPPQTFAHDPISSHLRGEGYQKVTGDDLKQLVTGNTIITGGDITARPPREVFAYHFGEGGVYGFASFDMTGRRSPTREGRWYILNDSVIQEGQVGLYYFGVHTIYRNGQGDYLEYFDWLGNGKPHFAMSSSTMGVIEGNALEKY